eukprot:1031483-Pelagomonas_calceolata.AAC.2
MVRWHGKRHAHTLARIHTHMHASAHTHTHPHKHPHTQRRGGKGARKARWLDGLASSMHTETTTTLAEHAGSGHQNTITAVASATAAAAQA